MFGVGNYNSIPMEVRLDFGNSQNLLCSGINTTEIKKVVQPNKIEFMMYTKRADISKAQKLDYHFSIREM